MVSFIGVSVTCSSGMDISGVATALSARDVIVSLVTLAVTVGSCIGEDATCTSLGFMLINIEVLEPRKWIVSP